MHVLDVRSSFVSMGSQNSPNSAYEAMSSGLWLHVIGLWILMSRISSYRELQIHAMRQVIIFWLTKAVA